MKYLLIFLACCFTQIAFSQGYTIDHYQVDVLVKENGSIEFTETLDVNFTEKRHGLLRVFPVGYNNIRSSEGVQSLSSKFNYDYHELVYKNFDCNYPFSTEFPTEFPTETNQNIRLKIGNADTYVFGKQQYIIKYIVWGIPNQFNDHDEVKLNIVGTQWECIIKDADFTIQFEKKPKVDGLVGFYGANYSIKRFEDVKFQNNRITGGLGNKSLTFLEGISITFNLNSDYFVLKEIPAEQLDAQFIFDSIKQRITVNSDGYCTINEDYYFSNGDLILNNFSPSYEFPLSASRKPRIKNIIAKCNSQEIYRSEQNTLFNHNSYSSFYKFDLDQASLLDKNHISIEYEASNLIEMLGPLVSLKYAMPSWRESNNPVAKYTLTVLAANEGNFRGATKECLSYIPTMFYHFGDSLEFNFKRAVFKRAKPGYNLHFENSFVDHVKLKKSFDADSYYHPYFSGKITIENNGFVTRNYELKSVEIGNHSYSYDYFMHYLIRWNNVGRYAYFDEESNPFELSTPNYNGLGSSYSQKHLASSSVTNGLMLQNERYSNPYFSYNVSSTKKLSEFPQSYSYETFGDIQSKGETYLFEEVILQPQKEPIDSLYFEINIPENIDLSKCLSKFSLYKTEYPIRPYSGVGEKTLLDESAYKIIESKHQIQVFIPNGLEKHNALILKLKFPKDSFSLSLYGRFRILITNNKAITILVLWLIVGFVLWLFFGRDRLPPIAIEYFPPKDFTPAEAGFLYDEKIHERDLVSLLYYWEGKGIISIENVTEKEKDDTIVTKLQPLGKDAKRFELTIFNSLFFASGTTRKLSSLTYTFGNQVRKAGDELEEYANKNDFYKTSSKLPSKIYKLAGILGSIFLVARHLYFSENATYVVIGCGFVGLLASIFIPKWLIKLDKTGIEKLHQLLGFREFIKKAESHKLKEITQNHPNYFSETIAYAVVMGLADKWADKFDEIGIKPPSMSSNALYTRGVISSMRRAEKEFFKRPVSTGSSSSSSSSGSSYSSSRSFSSSSSSSRSYSSSSSSRSYSSGGGYGGGGGSSW